MFFLRIVFELIQYQSSFYILIYMMVNIYESFIKTYSKIYLFSHRIQDAIMKYKMISLNTIKVNILFSDGYFNKT